MKKNNLEKHFSRLKDIPFEPEILDLSKTLEQKRFDQLVSKKQANFLVDDYKEQLKELFAIDNPKLYFSGQFNSKFEEYIERLSRKQPLWMYGKWVFYPWKASLVHVLNQEDFFKVRTARNKDLIEANEQERFYNTVVGIAGLSVGNSVALAIILQGGGRHIKLADFDLLALTNINRIRTSVVELGSKKVAMTARQIYEINPYAKIDVFPEGLDQANIDKFFSGLDIVVDEVDDLSLKVLIREHARKRKIPVVMAADNGDNGIIDVERYDKNPAPAFFHGRLGKVNFEKFKNLNKFETGRLITKLLGLENVTPRMHNSLVKLGKSLVSWPQLGGAALLNGSALAYVIRRIVNNQVVESNRQIISLDEKLMPGYFSKKEKNTRKKAMLNFKKTFNL